MERKSKSRNNFKSERQEELPDITRIVSVYWNSHDEEVNIHYDGIDIYSDNRAELLLSMDILKEVLAKLEEDYNETKAQWHVINEEIRDANKNA